MEGTIKIPMVMNMNLQIILVFEREVVHGRDKLRYLKQKWCSRLTTIGELVKKIFRDTETMGVGNINIS